MNEQQRAAFLTSQAACAVIEAIGMLSQNQHNSAGFNLREDFDALSKKYGIDHNSAITFITRAE